MIIEWNTYLKKAQYPMFVEEFAHLSDLLY